MFLKKRDVQLLHILNFEMPIPSLHDSSEPLFPLCAFFVREIAHLFHLEEEEEVTLHF